jgi:RNA polymerase sigma-70 factor (ECF subfamily)
VLLATDIYSRYVKENTEITLVRAALNGDADSFGALCERYYCSMVAIAYSRLSDRDLAEDAAQEAFFVAFRHISKLNKENHFSRWVAGICRNIASDMAKARIRNKVLSIQDCEPLSKDQAKEAGDVEIVRSIVAELPVKMKEVVFLRYYNQMSYQQIADVLGISQEAVNGRLRRAKRTVARELRRRASLEVEL